MIGNFENFLREWGSSLVIGTAGVACACGGWILKIILGEAWRVYMASGSVAQHTAEIRGLREGVQALGERLVRVETLLEGVVERLDAGRCRVQK